MSKFICVTRHSSMRSFVVRHVLKHVDSVRFLDHVEDTKDIEGKHVIGVLPLWLAAHAASITVIPLNAPPELRGKDLTYEELVSIIDGPPRTFSVEEVENPW